MVLHSTKEHRCFQLGSLESLRQRLRCKLFIEEELSKEICKKKKEEGQWRGGKGIEYRCCLRELYILPVPQGAVSINHTAAVSLPSDKRAGLWHIHVSQTLTMVSPGEEIHNLFKVLPVFQEEAAVSF